jgi:hypothetical protein
MCEPTNARSATRVFINKAYMFRPLINSATILRVYIISIRSTTEVVYDEILQDLIFFFFYWLLQPTCGFSLLILEVSRSHTMTQHSW